MSRKRIIESQRFELVKAILPNCTLACRDQNEKTIAQTAVLIADAALRILAEQPFQTTAERDRERELLRTGGA
jgi:hypothetical protein